MERWKLGLFYFFFKVANKCWCPLVVYMLLSIGEAVEMLAVLFHCEETMFKGEQPGYLQGISKVLNTYLVLFYHAS